MSGNYLKQLQLAKQMEQRTKDAAKNRKEAEERTAEAEKAISSTKAFDANAAVAEKLLVESSQALQQKDYRAALALAVKSIEAASDAKRNKVTSIIEDGEKLADLVGGKSLPAALSNSLKSARIALSEDRLEEALGKAGQSWDEVEKFVNARTAEIFSSAQSLLFIAERAGLKPENGKAMLAEARDSLERGKVAQAVEELNDCVATISAVLRNEFNARATSIEDMKEHAGELGKDFSKASDQLERAKASLDKGQFEAAYGGLASAQAEAKAVVTNGLLANFEVMKQRCANLKAYGADVGGALSDISQGRELARTERALDALAIWRRGESRLKEMEGERFLVLVAGLRSRLLIAAKVKAETAPVLMKLEEARKAFSKGAFELAVRQVREGEAILEQSLAGFKEVEAELAKTRALLAEAATLQVDLGAAKQLLDASRKYVISRDFTNAVKSLRRAQEEANRVVQDDLGGEIMRAEMRVTTALRLGADITAESALLEGIVAKVKRGEYAGLRPSIDTCIKEVDVKIRSIAESTVKAAAETLDAYSGPLDMANYRDSLDLARQAIRSGAPERAFELAQEVTDSMRRDEKRLLNTKMEDAMHLLSIAKDIGSASVILNDKLSKADDLRREGKVAESLRLIEEVMSYAKSIIRDELTRQLSQFQRSLSTAKKNGIEITQAERIADEAARVISRDDLEKGYSLTREAESTLDKLVTMHTQVYDRIAEISGLLHEAEAQRLDTAKGTEMLLSAKRLFEAGRYEEARPAAAKAYVEIEKLVAPFAAPKRLQNAKDLLAVAKRLGFDTAPVQKKIEGAEGLIQKKDFSVAMATIREAERTVLGLLMKGAETEIENIKGMMAKAKEDGADVSSVQQILSKGQTLLEERRVYDSLRALELARSELDQSLLMTKRTQDAIDRAQATLADAQEFGVRVVTASELLRQAKNYSKMGRQGLALELAKKAADQADQAANGLVLGQMRKLELNYRSMDLEGQDLDSTMHMKDEIEKRLDAKRLHEASALLHNFEEELSKVKAQKELSAKALEDIDRKVAEAKGKGHTTANVESLLAQSHLKFNEGSFYESFNLAMRGGDELKGSRELFDRRSAELQELIRDAQELEGEDAAGIVGELIDQAKRHLASSDFEAATLTIRRGKQAARTGMASARQIGLKRLDELLSLLDEMGIDRSTLPLLTRNLSEARNTGKPIEPKALKEANAGLASMAEKKLQERMKELEGRLQAAKGAGADVSASAEFMLRTSASLRAGAVRDAYCALLDADKHIGVALEEQRGYLEVRTNVEARIEKARTNGLELDEAIALYREAESLKHSDHPLAVKKMQAALAAAEREAADFLPELQVDIDFLEELTAGQWCRAKLRYSNDGKAMAREICVNITGGAESRGVPCLPKLRGGEKAELEIEIMPKTAGRSTANLSLECRPVLSNDSVGFDTEFEIEAH